MENNPNVKVYLVRSQYTLKDGTVKQYTMRQRKVLKRDPNGIAVEVRDAILADYNAGMKKKDILPKYGITYHQLCKIIQPDPRPRRVQAPEVVENDQEVVQE